MTEDARHLEPGAALRAAIQHHQAGRLGQAEALYRQVLQAQPQNPDALHLLGVIATLPDGRRARSS